MLFRNASPRGEEGNSFFILKELRNWLSEEPGYNDLDGILNLPRNINQSRVDILEKMYEADCWIISFPLYVDGLPGHLTWWLEQCEEYGKANQKKNEILVYTLINCGFPEAVQNRDALRIMKIFCRKSGLLWRLGVGIGMGEAYKKMGSMPLKSKGKAEILNSYQTIKKDLESDRSKEDFLFASVKFPRFLYRLMGTQGWKRQAVRNGIKAKDLYARPYAR